MRWVLMELGWPKELAQIVEDYASIISAEPGGKYRLLVGFMTPPAYLICDYTSANISLGQLHDHYSVAIRTLGSRLYERMYVDPNGLEKAHRDRENVVEAICWLSRH
jgi:hypothetical protein